MELNPAYWDTDSDGLPDGFEYDFFAEYLNTGLDNDNLMTGCIPRCYWGRKDEWPHADRANLLNKINSRSLILLFDCCFANGFIEDRSNDFTVNNRVILASTGESDLAWGNTYSYYTYYFVKALQRGLSLEEAHYYAENNIISYPEIWDFDPFIDIYLWR